MNQNKKPSRKHDWDATTITIIPAIRFEDAKSYLAAWMPKPEMLNEIQQANVQTSLFERGA